jgi:hypothetical protein
MKNAGRPSRNRASHFESGYHLTLLYLPPEESTRPRREAAVRERKVEGVDWRERLDGFVAETDRVFTCSMA